MPKTTYGRVIDTPYSTQAARAQGATAGSTVVTVTDHGGLAGLTDDDHAQYLRADGTRTGASTQAQTLTAGVVINGAVQFAYVAKTDNYTLDTTDCVVALSVASKTLTLPTAVGCKGRRYALKATIASGTITVDGDGAETIDGEASQTLYPADCMEVVSNGAGWEIV